MRTLTWTCDDAAYEGVIVEPDHPVASPPPGVVLCHEWSGLNDGMRRIAAGIAGLGYTCVAIDVYGRGIRGDERGDNAHLMNPLLADRGSLRRRLLAGFAAAAGCGALDPTRLAVVGYCFGGLCALDLARAAPNALVACVSIHGVLAPSPLPTQPISSSVLLLHGWDDPIAPPADVLAIARELTAAGADWQLLAFGHARHAFTFEGAYLPERGIAYHAPSARRAWAAMRSFLAEQFAR